MKPILILSIALILNACCKSNHNNNTDIPACIQSIIENPDLSIDLQTVKVQEVDNELHYWLNTDYTHFDGVEYIVNSTCDTVCSFCGDCFPLECTSNYVEPWTTIWEN